MQKLNLEILSCIEIFISKESIVKNLMRIVYKQRIFVDILKFILTLGNSKLIQLFSF